MPISKYRRRAEQIRRRGFQPGQESLESRIALAIDLIDTVGNVSDPAAGPGPYGVAVLNGDTQANSALNNQGAGYSVAYLGDTNGDRYEDVLIGAPQINSVVTPPVLGAGRGNAYLMLGSRRATSSGGTASDFLNLRPNQGQTTTSTVQERYSRLFQLNQLNQTVPPTDDTPGFDYAGVTFTIDNNANLGASVARAGDLNNDGREDFLIGAPGQNLAFLVYGSQNFQVPAGPAIVNLTVPVTRTNVGGVERVTVNTAGLDSLALQGIFITVFVGPTGSNAGFSVAGAGNVYHDNTSGTQPDLVIGAPGTAGREGFAYLISGQNFSDLNTVPRAVVLQDVATGASTGSYTGGTTITPQAGVKFRGTTDSLAGFSVASAGNIDNDTISNRSIDDLLIGAPARTGVVGRVFLIYGDTEANFLAAMDDSSRPGVISLAQVGVDGDQPANTTAVPGASFFPPTGAADDLGFSVSTAGDFDDDGFGDFMFGDPLGVTPAAGITPLGDAWLIYGRPATPANPGRILGRFTLNDDGTITSNPPTGGTAIVSPRSVMFVGEQSGSMAGHALSAVGPLTSGDDINEIVLGSPGFSANQGRAYLIPGNATALTGRIDLGAAIESNPINGLIMDLTITGVGAPSLGAAVSGRVIRVLSGGRFVVQRPTRTMDNDNVGDFVVAAPTGTFDPNWQIRTGNSYLLEGALLFDQGVTPPQPPSVSVAQAVSPPILQDTATLPLGERLVPRFNTLGRLSYRPIPVSVAYRQYFPTRGFAFRSFRGNQTIANRLKHNSLPDNVFTRGQGKVREPYRHPYPTVPARPYGS